MENGTGPVAVCVVGCGHWGRNLVRNFHDLGNLYAICESDEQTRARIQSAYPSAKAYAALDQALADPAVKAVVVASPAQFHYEMALAAMQAGKDVFVEKPLALTWHEGMELVKYANEHN